MKFTWTLTSLLVGFAAGIITFLITHHWILSLVSFVAATVLVLMNNPKRRYMKAFYVVLFPLLSNLYFELQLKTDNLSFQGGQREPDWSMTVMLGVIAIICLILDYLERNEKLGEGLFVWKRNQVGNITGNNNQINQRND